MGIVLAEYRIVELHHFRSSDNQAFLLKTGNDFTGKAALNA